MSIKRLVPLNTASLANDPSTARTGDIYYNNVLSQLRYFDGTNWIVIAGSTNGLVNAKSIYQDVRNQSGVDMAAATPVYISSAIGASSKMLVTAASNNAESTSSKTMGLTTTAISNNSNGQVISEGLLENIDTTGANDGDPVWLGVNGEKIYGLINKPSAPAHLVFLGIVIRGGSVNTGSIYVKIQNGFELHELHNVEVSSLVNGNILAYDSTTQTWKNTNTLQSTSSTVPLIIKSSSGQSANLTQWQNSSGLAFSGILYDGSVSIQRTAKYSFNNGATGNERANIASNSNNELVFNIADGLTEVAHFYGGISPTNAIQFNNVTGYPTANVFVIKGAASQSGDYLQIQNSGGTVLAQLNSNNQFNVNYGSSYAQGGFRGGVNNHIGFAALSGFAYSPAYLAIGARGAANQIANLQEWQNSAGTVLNGVNAVGQIFTGSATSIPGAFAGNSTTAASGDGTTATITTTGAHGFAVGDFITVAGVTPTGYNGTFYITAVPTSTQISYANTTTGAQTIAGTVTNSVQVSITPRTARTKGLVIKGATSQSNTLQEWQNSSGTVLVSINNGGSLQLSNSGTNGIGGLSAGVMWYVVSGSSGYRPLVVQAATSQTGDLTAWQNSSGTVVTKVNAAGNIGVGSGTTALSYGLDVFTGSARIWNGITGAGQTGTLYLGDGSLTKSYGSGWELYGALVTTGGYGISSNANLDAGGTTLGYGRLSVNTGATTTVGAVIRGIASQTADLQQWQDSAGNIKAFINSAGAFISNQTIGSSGYMYSVSPASFGSSGLTNSYQLQVINGATTRVGLMIQGVASQTANLQEWQNSSGTVLAKISAGGDVSSNSYIRSTYFGYATDGTSNTASWAYLSGTTAGGLIIKDIPLNTSNPTLIVQGAASKTADLQQWRNSSDTVLSKISSSGAFISTVDMKVNVTTIGNGGGAIDTNIAFGYNVLSANTTGNQNTAIGYNALIANTTGANNFALGTASLSSNVSGSGNVAIGSFSLPVNTASNNVGIGVITLYSNTTGYGNIAIGAQALQANTTGISNTAIGQNALYSNTTGYFNTVIGSGAGFSSTGAANVFIGYNAGANETSSNKLYIANSNTSTPLIGGDFSAKTLTINGNQSIISQNNSTVALTIKGASGQQQYLSIQDSGGVAGIYVDQYMQMIHSTNTYFNAIVNNSANWSISNSGSLNIKQITSNISSTISINTASTVDTVALSSFTSMEYTLSIKQGSKIRSSKVLVHTDGTSVDSTEYSIMEMGGGISGILVTASVSSTNAILQVTITDAATTNATVKLIKTML